MGELAVAECWYALICSPPFICFLLGVGYPKRVGGARGGVRESRPHTSKRNNLPQTLLFAPQSGAYRRLISVVRVSVWAEEACGTVMRQQARR